MVKGGGGFQVMVGECVLCFTPHPKLVSSMQCNKVLGLGFNKICRGLVGFEVEFQSMQPTKVLGLGFKICKG